MQTFILLVLGAVVGAQLSFVLTGIWAYQCGLEDGIEEGQQQLHAPFAADVRG